MAFTIIKFIISLIQKQLAKRSNASSANASKSSTASALPLVTISQILPYIQYLCLIIPIANLFILPSEYIANDVRVDENAMQSGQNTPIWSWDNVAVCDSYARSIESVPLKKRSQWVSDQFAQLGFETGIQTWGYKNGKGGNNTWALHKTGKKFSPETLLLAADWESKVPFGHEGFELRRDAKGVWNVRGVAAVLCLSDFMSKQNYWSKDLMFVISEGGPEGMHAYLSEFYSTQSSALKSSPIDIAGTSLIQNAITISFSSDSFSHLSLLHTGINSRLPNLDILASLIHVIKWVANVPVRLHMVQDWLRQDFGYELLDSWLLKKYELAVETIFHSLTKGAKGSPDSIAGVMGLWRINAVELMAVPAEGPHGFHALGISLEAGFRALNNLAERLHASVFFYQLLQPHKFVKMGFYLLIAILPGAFLTITALRPFILNQPSKQDWFAAISTIISAHAIFGFFTWLVVVREHSISGWPNFLLALQAPMSLANINLALGGKHALRLALLFWAGMMLPVLALVNFPLALATTIIFLPVALPNPPTDITMIGVLGSVVLSPPIILMWAPETAKEIAGQYLTLGNYTAPWVGAVIAPIVALKGAEWGSDLIKRKHIMPMEADKKTK